MLSEDIEQRCSQEIEMQRRFIILPLQATPAELRHIASCIQVGNEEHEDTFEYNQAEALAERLNTIAHAIESGRTDHSEFLLPYLQQGIATGEECTRTADFEAIAGCNNTAAH
jgi:hypothetical protein